MNEKKEIRQAKKQFVIKWAIFIDISVVLVTLSILASIKTRNESLFIMLINYYTK